MKDRFSELISELGHFLNISLHVDPRGSCLLQVHHKIKIQLQPNLAETHLLMVCTGIELPPGKFRENVLKEGLKANALADPRPLICSYVGQNNHFVFYQSFPFEILNGERLAALFGSFLTETESWVQAIEQGRAAPVISEPKNDLNRPFGIKL